MNQPSRIDLNRLGLLLIDAGTWVLLVVLPGAISWRSLRDYSASRADEAGAEDRRQRGAGLTRRSVEWLFALQEQASAHTDDKVKQLLGLTVALNTVILFLAYNLHMKAVAGAVIPLFASMCLLIRCLGVRPYWDPDPERADVESGEREYVGDLFDSLKCNESAHNIRVEMYRAAMRWFFLAMVTIGFVAISQSLR